MRVEKDFEELLKLFNKNKVRYTKDIDILVDPDIENAKKIVKSLDEFGFKSLNLSEKDFSQEGKVVQLGYEPVRVDLITSIKGLTFKKVWENKITGPYGKEKVFFIGRDDLIKSKKISKRKIDLADLDILARK